MTSYSTLSPAVRLFHLGAVDVARRRLWHGVDERDMFWALVTRDAPADEIDDLLGGRRLTSFEAAHRLDGFAPLRVGDADDDDFGDRRMRRDLALDLRRIDVFAARLDQFLGRRAALVPQIAVGIERALIAGVMPLVAEGQRIVGI